MVFVCPACGRANRDLRSKTSGRAVYSMTFDSYAEVPKAVADEIVQKNKGE